MSSFPIFLDIYDKNKKLIQSLSSVKGNNHRNIMVIVKSTTKIGSIIRLSKNDYLRDKKLTGSYGEEKLDPIKTVGDYNISAGEKICLYA